MTNLTGRPNRRCYSTQLVNNSSYEITHYANMVS